MLLSLIQFQLAQGKTKLCVAKNNHSTKKLISKFPFSIAVHARAAFDWWYILLIGGIYF